MNQVKRRSTRPPARLRTKTGCSKCRERRKKCDELRPICSACIRLNSDCEYRDQNDTDRGFSPETASSPGSEIVELLHSPSDVSSSQTPLCTSIWVKPSGLCTDRDYHVFQYCATQYVQHLITPEAGADFRDVSFVFAVGFDSPWVIHAALAPAALHASFTDLIPKEAAINYTQSALHGLQQALQAKENRYSWRQPFLAASLFLGVFEDFYSTAHSHSLIHYKAMAEVLEDAMADIVRLHLSSLSVFERTVLDSVLYHYSTRLLFEPDIDAISNSFPSSTMAKYIEAVEADGRDPHVSRPVLPVLGKTPPALFLLIFQITWLSRQLPFDDELTLELAAQCQTELERIENEIETLQAAKSSGPFEVETEPGDKRPLTSNGDVAAGLYLIAARIFVTKVLDPGETATDSRSIQALLATGGELLKSYNTNQPYSQFICWPVLILGLAACPVTLEEACGAVEQSSQAQLRCQMRELILDKLLQVWKLSFSGFVKRTADSLKRVWNLHSSLRQEPSKSEAHDPWQFSDDPEKYDGLNALIAKEGLVAMFEG